MSIIISSLLIFFFYLSIHTCNARYLGVMDAKPSHKMLLFSTKVLESVELNRDDPIALQNGTSGDDINFYESHDSVKPKDSDDSLLKEMKQNREISAVPVPIEPLVSVSGRVPRKNFDERTENFKPSTHLGLLRATTIEGSRRRGLFVSVEDEHEHEHEHGLQDRDRYKARQLEDASLTDYDPPHQTPPIHNRKNLNRIEYQPPN